MKMNQLSPQSLKLPFHLIQYQPLIAEVSDKGDCFLLFFHLYPTSAGIKDGHGNSPYNLAVRGELRVYFIRLLLAADIAIDPIRRSNLHYLARRDGMFLAFRALFTNRCPIIWAKIRHRDEDLLSRVISYL